MVHVTAVIRPNRRNRRAYEALYQTYVGLYPRLKDLYQTTRTKVGSHAIP